MERSPIDEFSLTIGNATHELTDDQLALLNEWLTGVAGRIDEIYTKSGRGFLVDKMKSQGRVYAGVSGGNLTFAITPTTIGTVFKVSESITGESIDLTDYENW